MLLSDNVVTCQKTAIFMVTTMRKPKLRYVKLYTARHTTMLKNHFLILACSHCASRSKLNNSALSHTHTHTHSHLNPTQYTKEHQMWPVTTKYEPVVVVVVAVRIIIIIIIIIVVVVKGVPTRAQDLKCAPLSFC